MPQSLARITLHLVFGTKNRLAMIKSEVQDPLNRYMAQVLINKGCHVIEINSVEDHVHLLFDLPRTLSASDAVEHLKAVASKWIKDQPGIAPDFAWQGGYGIFAVSASNIPAVREYVQAQQEHHRVKSFKDELLALLVKHGIEFDERYLWN
jgi:REP element-mobilizing transposase RayT